MKKFILTLAAFLGLTAALNAQTYVGDIGGYFSSIPGEFTTNGHPYVVFETYSDDDHYNFTIYQSDFTTHVTDINNIDHCETVYMDLNSTSQRGIEIAFTQSLFNTDNYFEYVEEVYDVYYDTVFYNPEEYYVDEHYYTKAINIKSTNGNTLWSFNAEERFSCNAYVYKVDNKYYLLVNEDENYHDSYGYDYPYEHRRHLYLISQGHGLTEVSNALPLSVFPSIANRSQQITVELGEGNNATEVTVVNGLGQVIKRIPVREGQRSISIPASGLGSGLNVVNTRTQQGQGSCKIIVH